MAFKWFPLRWRRIIEWYKSHTFSSHFSLPSFLLALIIPKASQEYPTSWDFKHQRIPAPWTPCLLLFSNAMTYNELSQAREEWRSKHGLVGGRGLWCIGLIDKVCQASMVCMLCYTCIAHVWVSVVTKVIWEVISWLLHSPAIPKQRSNPAAPVLLLRPWNKDGEWVALISCRFQPPGSSAWKHTWLH